MYCSTSGDADLCTYHCNIEDTAHARGDGADTYADGVVAVGDDDGEDGKNL